MAQSLLSKINYSNRNYPLTTGQTQDYVNQYPVQAYAYNQVVDFVNNLETRLQNIEDGSFSTNSITETTALADITVNSALIEKHATAVANSTATLTAAQVKTGYITSTSAAPTTLTLPTGTLLGAALGAVQGTIFNLYIDNTAGANTVTIAVAVNGILSAMAAANAASSGLLTIPSGVTGQACFRLMFSSATAYTFTRVA